MSFIKKKFNLNGHARFHSVIDNKQLHQIATYQSILSLAQQDAQVIIDSARIEANQIVEQANQSANDIINHAEKYQHDITQESEQKAHSLLEDANAQVVDIISNSEQNAAQQVWQEAQQLLEQLQQAHDYFYVQTQDLVKGLLATIIKRLTQNLSVQERMYILVDQVFAKAKDIEYASLFFSPKDFESLPKFHIPQTWKVEKDNMLDVGWVKLVGAGGEWKTSITSIQSKILKSIDYKGEALIDIPDIIEHSSLPILEEQAPNPETIVEDIANHIASDIDNTTPKKRSVRKSKKNEPAQEQVKIEPEPEVETKIVAPKKISKPRTKKQD